MYICMTKTKDMLDRAIQIAVNAHAGQKDKGGNPYILHPLWVMNKIAHFGEATMIVGILHDVVEDTEWTIDKLREEGFSDEVLSALTLLDFREVDYDTRIKEISFNNIATRVKLADLEHNLRPYRLKGLRKKDHERIEKYHRAYTYLNY